MSRYIIKTASARSTGRYGCYKHIAVLEVEDGCLPPRMISPRAIGVIRIVRMWPKRSVGKSARCQFAKAMVEAQALLNELCGQKQPT